MSGELRAVRDDHAVADVTVVREVHVRHQEAVLPDRRLERLRRSAIDRGVFADRRAVADLDRRRLALVLEILRVAAEHGSDADLHVGAESDVALERRARRRSRIPSPIDAVLADDRERADLDAVARARRVGWTSAVG